MIQWMSSLVPRPRPAFRRFQYFVCVRGEPWNEASGCHFLTMQGQRSLVVQNITNCKTGLNNLCFIISWGSPQPHSQVQMKEDSGLGMKLGWPELSVCTILAPG